MNCILHIVYTILVIIKKYSMQRLVKCEILSDYKLYYFDNDWQTPIKTELSVFDNIKKIGKLYENYFAFPWATMIDKSIKNIDNDYLDILNNITNINGSTVCQHIHYKWLFPIWRRIGIHTVYACHCSINDNNDNNNDNDNNNIFNIYSINIKPFQLYPYIIPNNETVLTPINKRKYLASFIGAYNDTHYISDIRKKIFATMSKYKNVYLKLRHQWHYETIVYEKQILGNIINNDQLIDNENEYKQILLDSIFSLCPSGTGPNSIRFWESIAFGTIPVLLSNHIKLPEFINWNKICVIYDESKISNLYSHLLSYSMETIIEMSNNCHIIYKYIFNQNFIHKNLYIYQHGIIFSDKHETEYQYPGYIHINQNTNDYNVLLNLLQ